MSIGKREVMIAIAAAVAWYLLRKKTAGVWSDATGQTYAVTEQQRQMLAAQDAAFSYTQDFQEAPFHGAGVL